jgi:hypothetical protein
LSGAGTVYGFILFPGRMGDTFLFEATFEVLVFLQKTKTSKTLKMEMFLVLLPNVLFAVFLVFHAKFGDQ